MPEPIIGLNSDVQNLLVHLENQINCTCNRCGKRPASYRHLDHRVFEVNQSVLCDECFSKDFAVAQPRNSEKAFVVAPSIDIVKEDVNLKTPSNIKTNWIRKIKKMFAFLSINNR
jgi:7,8-dihydro-6-hydroxymethylpterin-pyrophosphokinase